MPIYDCAIDNKPTRGCNRIEARDLQQCCDRFAEQYMDDHIVEEAEVVILPETSRTYYVCNAELTSVRHGWCVFADEMEWTEEEIDRRFSIGEEIPL